MTTSPIEQMDLHFSLDSANRLFKKSSSMEMLDWREQSGIPDHLPPIPFDVPFYPPLLSPSTLTLGEIHNSVDPNEVCMGHFPSFLTKSKSNEHRMSIELPFPISKMSEDEPLPLPENFSCSILPACSPVENDDLSLPFPNDDDESLYDPYEWKEETEEMERMEEVEKRPKQNHTWEETACQLRLNMSAPEMSAFSIPGNGQWEK